MHRGCGRWSGLKTSFCCNEFFFGGLVKFPKTTKTGNCKNLCQIQLGKKGQICALVVSISGDLVNFYMLCFFWAKYTIVNVDGATTKKVA